MKAIAKNNIFKIIVLLICVALFLTGCATVSDVRDRNGNKITFDDIQYFEGQVAVIGDYLYYANSYTSSSDENFDYDTAASTGYLNRINLSSISYDYTADEDGYVNPSPIGSEMVNDRFVGFENQYMFALGEYLYFTSVNTHRTTGLENDYSQVSLFRVKFNGDKFDEIETFRYDENSIITAQKGDDGNYYYIVYCPADSEATSYNLYSIRIGSKIGDTTLLEEEVTSVAICDEDSQFRNVLFTTAAENEYYETTAIKEVNFATGEVSDYSNGLETLGSTTTFMGRFGDIVVYSYSSNITPQSIFYKDLANDDKLFNGGNEFYPSHSNITLYGRAGDGYLFLSETSGSLMYKPTLGMNSTAEEGYVDPTPIALLTSDSFSDILFVDGDYVYYSNSTSISRISVRDRVEQQLVSMTSIVSGECGYDGNYIYFYAQLEEQESDTEEEEDSDSTETATDENYYLYRVNKTGYLQLLSKVEKPE